MKGLRQYTHIVMAILLVAILAVSSTPQAKAQDEPQYAYLTFYTYFQGIDTTQQCSANRTQLVHFQFHITTLYYDYTVYTDCTGAATFGPFATLGTTIDYWAKGTKWLAVGAYDVPASGINSMTVFLDTARAGDVTNNNLVDASDFNSLKLAFGTTCGMPGYDVRCDFNQDCHVDASDFNYLKLNYGAAGMPPIYP